MSDNKMKSSFIDSMDLKRSTTSSQPPKDQAVCDSLSRSGRSHSVSIAEEQVSAGKKMQSRGRMINRLALILLSIVVLELVLIGDQVQPVKAIKKKIYLKKLKKLLPLLALVKPKKKIILVPIPIPMFKNSGHRYPYPSQYPQPPPHQHHMNGRPPQMQPPMSFTMMGDMPLEPGLVGVSMDSGPAMLPMSMDPFAMMGFVEGRPQPTTPAPSAPPSSSPPANGSSASGNDTPPPVAMMVPSMTMTIQSEPGGNSAIELSTNMNSASPNASGALLQQPPHNKWGQLQQQQQQQLDGFDEPAEAAAGEPYYSSPWINRPPPAAPAKAFRSERLRARQPLPLPPPTTHQPRAAPPTQSHRQTVLMKAPQWTPSQQLDQQPVVVIRNQWRPSPPARLQQQSQFQQSQQSQQQQQEFEELIPIGPPQMMPVYQTANGQLHMSPPPPTERPAPGGVDSSADLNSEVTVGPSVDAQPQRPLKVTINAGGRLTSPAVKGKQQQQQQQQQQFHQQPAKQKQLNH